MRFQREPTGTGDKLQPNGDRMHARRELRTGATAFVCIIDELRSRTPLSNAGGSIARSQARLHVSRTASGFRDADFQTANEDRPGLILD